MIKLIHINVLMNDPPLSFTGIFSLSNAIPNRWPNHLGRISGWRIYIGKCKTSAILEEAMC